MSRVTTPTPIFRLMAPKPARAGAQISKVMSSEIDQQARRLQFERLTSAMVTQRKPKASKYLTTPTRPVQVDRVRSVAGLLEKMEGAGFGGRQLAEAHR